MLNSKVSGLKELQRILSTLPKNVQRKALTNSTRAGAAVVGRAARDKVSVRTGKTRKNIKWQRNKDLTNSDIAVFDIGVTQLAFYWRFLEFGTAHSAPIPFLVPALEENQAQVIKAISTRLKKAIVENGKG